MAKTPDQIAIDYNKARASNAQRIKELEAENAALRLHEAYELDLPPQKRTICRNCSLPSDFAKLQIELEKQTTEVGHPIDCDGKVNHKRNYCYSCGATVKNQKYCHNCGRKLFWKPIILPKEKENG